MRITLASIRVRLSLIYIFFMLASMVSLGCISYWHLNEALASSRQHTMEARERRLIKFINAWPQPSDRLTLADKLRQLTLAVASTDTIKVDTLDGSPIYSSPVDPSLKAPWPGRPCIEVCHSLIEQNGHRLRTLNHIVQLDGQTVRLSLAGTIDEHFEVLTTIRNSYLFLCPLILLASIVGGVIFSRRALEPIRRITGEAKRIGIQDLERRVAVPKTGDELQVLAETWNQLLARIESAVKTLSQFTGDISHDLNTSITVMLTTASLALSRKRSNEEYQAALETIALECDATSQLLNDLLAVARGDLVHQNIEREPIVLSDIVQEVCQQVGARAKVKDQTLSVDARTEACIAGDPNLMRRLVAILLDNAIKYTPQAGAVSVRLHEKNRDVVLEVRDSGIGISEEALPKIFDRFYRVDKSRSQDEGSSGLGLSIAKWVVEAHDSIIQVSSKPGLGTVFTVIIPKCESKSYEDHLKSSLREVQAI